MEFSQWKYLELSIESRILIIAISNSPHNYLPGMFFIELAGCQELMRSSDTDAVMFTGKGNVFSKGGDLEEIKSMSNPPDLKAVLFAQEVFTFISRLTKPVIAAINGPCLGSGLELALSCHIRLCSEKAWLGLPEVSIGLLPGLGGIQLLTRVVGESKALEMILLGDILSASKALELNLVSRVFPKKDFLSKALLFVKTLLSTRREALEEVLRLVVLSRSENEDRLNLKAAESFIRLISK